MDKKIIVLDAFWDGGICPVVTRYMDLSYNIYNQGTGERERKIDCIPSTEQMKVSNPNYWRFLKVQSIGHYFAYADGTPVLILADCHIFGTNSDSRKSFGFNGMSMRLAKRKAVNEGGPSYENREIDRLNPEYFRWIDKRLQKLWDIGFISIFMPDFLENSGYTYDDVKDNIRHLLARYSSYNIMYIVTGEFDNRRNEEIWATTANWFRWVSFLGK